MKFHSVTWCFIAIGIFETVLNIGAMGPDLASISQGHFDNRHPFFVLRILLRPEFFYALTWFGTAAMLEFLYRIWHELRLQRLVIARKAQSDTDQAE